MGEIGFRSSIIIDCLCTGAVMGRRCAMGEARERGKVERKRCIPLRKVLWIGAALFGGILLWRLFVVFPGRLTASDYPHLTKLLLLLIVLSFALFVFDRKNIGRVVRNFIVWVAIIGAIALVYVYRADLSGIYNRVMAELIPGRVIVVEPGVIEVVGRSDGHYYLDGTVKGRSVTFLVDTGASDIVLNLGDAMRIGIDTETLNFTQRYQTANGLVWGAPYRLERLQIGPFDFPNVSVSVSAADMGASLLGVSFLERFRSYEFKGGKLYLRL